MSFPLGAEVRKARARELLRFPARLGQLAVRFLGKAELVGALDGHFFCHVEDLATMSRSFFFVSSSTTPLQEVVISRGSY